MNLFNSNRCKVCKKLKGHRFCIREKGNICWQDCNKLRIDLKCPENCRYSLKQNAADQPAQLFEYKTNADSRTEFTDLLKQEIDKWVNTKLQFLENKTPLDVASSEAGRQKLTAFFKGFNIPEHIPLSYLKSRLDLEDLPVQEPAVSFEDVVFEYLDNIIALDWEKTLDLVHGKDKFQETELKTSYLKRLSSDKVMKKMKYYHLISSALSEDKKTALVYLEINGKFEITVSLKKQANKWSVSGRMYGKPELYNGENEAIKQVAVLLSANKIAEVFPLLKKYSAIYPDSSDLHYYWGLYYTFAKNAKKAKNYFLNAVELDPQFLEAKYNYAYVLHSEKETSRAKKLYQDILSKDPQEVKTLNNLASILIDEGELKEAQKLLEKALQLDPEFSVAAQNLERLKALL